MRAVGQMRFAYSNQSAPVTSLLVLFAASIVALTISASTTFSQTTSFTYQGRLTDSANPVNGNYDFEFKLFDMQNVGSGTQYGPTIQQLNVIVTNGVFSVQLSFGPCTSCFNGSDRYLEIGLKPVGTPTFTTLSPRQQITSTPNAIKSMGATSADGLSVACVTCVTSSQIASVSGSAISGTIPVASVPSGSGNYIQNTSSAQASSNFNITGSGRANVFDATSQFNINGSRVLSNAGTQNLFAGVGSGQANTASYNAFFGWRAGNANATGEANSFFGESSGLSNTTGFYNSFFGTSAGRANTTGVYNSFFGTVAGYANNGENNSFFGNSAGYANTAGSRNSFFGSFAGAVNTTGEDNSYFGYSAGGQGASRNSFFGSLAGAESTGSNNSFFGYQAGRRNTTGDRNSFFGESTGSSNTTGNVNTFVGSQAGNRNTTACCNSFFGGSAGSSNTTGYANSFFGQLAGADNTAGTSNSFFGTLAGVESTLGFGNTFFGYEAGRYNKTGSLNTMIGSQANVGSDALVFATAIGAAARVDQSNSLVLGSIGTKVGIGTTAPLALLDVRGDVYVGLSDANGVTTPGNNIYVANDSGDSFNSLRIDGYQNNLYLVARSVAGAGTGAGIVFRTAPAGAGELDRVAIDQNGLVYVSNLASGVNTTQLCRNFSNQLADCSSSLRYKTDLRPFTGGLSIINRLRPISFAWKKGGMRDIGLGAEDVAQVEPLFTFTNAKGEIEGVKYDQLSVVFINAIKEQQAQIRERERQADLQREQIAQYRKELAQQQPRINQQQSALSAQQNEIEALQRLVCLSHPKAEVCKRNPSDRRQHFENQRVSKINREGVN